MVCEMFKCKLLNYSKIKLIIISIFSHQNHRICYSGKFGSVLVFLSWHYVNIIHCANIQIDAIYINFYSIHILLSLNVCI